MKTNATFVPCKPDGSRDATVTFPARTRGPWAITAMKQRKGTYYTLNHIGTGAYLFGAKTYQALEAVSLALDALPVAWESLGTLAEFNALPVELRQVVGRTGADTLAAYEESKQLDDHKKRVARGEEAMRYLDGVPYDEAPKAKPVALGAGSVYLVTVNGEQWYGDGCFMAIGEAPARWNNASVNNVSEGAFNQIMPRRVEDESATLATYQEVDRTGFVDTACGVRFNHARLAACLRAGGKGATLHVNTISPTLSPALVKSAEGKTVALIMPCKKV